MDISGGYTHVSPFSVQLPESILKSGNRESLKSQPNTAPTHSTARFSSAKERQELLTTANTFKYELFDKISRSFYECKEDMPRILSSDNNVIDKKRTTMNQSMAKEADLSISSGTSHSTQKKLENNDIPTTTMRGRTEWRQVDLSNRSRSLDWRVSKRNKKQENRMEAISNTKNYEDRSIQLSLMKNIELSTVPKTSSTSQKKPVKVEIPTTNAKERTELKQVYLSNRSKSVDWSESKFKERQENQTDVIINTKDHKGGSIKCSESLALNDASIRPNISELDNHLKKVSLYFQPHGGLGQRKQNDNEFIFVPVSETLPVRMVKSKSPWYSEQSGTKPDKSEHHFRLGVNSSNISDNTRNEIVIGKNGCTVLEASSEGLHEMITPVSFVSIYSTESNNCKNPKKHLINRSISVISQSDTNTFPYKPEKYGTFPKAMPDTSFLPNGKGNSDTMSRFFNDKTLQNSISLVSNNSISNDRLLIRNSIGLGTQSLGRKRDRHFTTSTSFAAYGLMDNNSIQKSTKNETEMPEEKTTVNDKLTKGMGTTTIQIPCLASVRSKIDKFEALAQQSQTSSGLQPPRRAFSVTEMPKVMPSLNKAYSDRSLGKRLGDWNREFLKENLFKSEVSNEAAAKQDLNVSVQTITQDKEGSTLKTPTSKSNESEVTQTLKLEELPSKQRNGRFTMLNKNLDEPDFFKGNESYQPSKSIYLYENKVSNDLSSFLPHNPQKSSDKDSKLKNQLCFQTESTSLLQNVHSSTKVKTQSHLFYDSEVMPSVQGLGDLSNPYSSIKDKKGAEKVIRWIMDKGADDEIGEDGIDDEDGEGTERSYDSDSGESSVTITSNMSNRSFSMSLVDLCSLGGLDLSPLDGGGSKDDEDWMSKRTVSMSSDVSALSSVTLLDMDELECLLNDVRGLDDNSLENYEDVHVVVLHKEAGSGLGFTVAGGVDQNKPVTVHKVLPNGIAAREGSIHEGDQVLSINGTALHNSTHKEALQTMKKARGRAMTVVVIRRGDVTETCYSLKDSMQKPVGTLGCRIRVLLNKCSSDLGFSLEGGVGSTSGDKPLTVQRLFQGGPVGKVFPGDELLEVEGQSLEGLRRLEVWQLIKRLPPGPVEVLLQRPYQQ